MRIRFPLVLGLSLLLCLAAASSPQTAARKRTAIKRRKPAPPPISATMRADSVAKVDRYLTESAERAIEQPGALAPFFEQLSRLAGEHAAPVHIIHWGDSHTAADEWTGGLRDLFRERFGDGGSGFSVAGHPFPGYRRFDARGGASSLWTTVGGRAGNGDGWFGLGGVGVYASRTGQSVWVDVDCERLEIHYLQQPGGGRVSLSDNDQHLDTFSTDGETSAGVVRYTVSPGPHRFTLRTIESRPVRLFGWVADKPAGVTYEALGLNGAEAGVILKWNPDMLAAYLQHRNPGLIVLAYGTNEASDPAWRTESYRDNFAQVIARLRQISPAASILVVGPDDRWSSSSGGRRPLAGIDDVIRDQRSVCRELGCAYWDLRNRTGGKGSMRDWVYAGFAQPDYVHFTSIGYRRLAAVLFGDLMQQYEAFRKSRAMEPTLIDHE